LIDTPERVAGVMLVGAQLGYFGHWPLFDRIVYGRMWSTLVPAAVDAFGYWPAWMGLGVDLPGGVAREWAQWCSSPGYMLDHDPDAEWRLFAVDRPILYYSFTDDSFAPKPAIDAFVATLRPSRVIHRRFEPAELARESIDHFGFFRRGVVPGLWDEAIEFFDALLRSQQPALRSRNNHTLELDLEEIQADLAYGRS
jgi:predicted alpha/beta hydrolase